jgi:class 3 adenylate cyclase/tetratricopeptide (TPR) repeat protein
MSGPQPPNDPERTGHSRVPDTAGLPHDQTVDYQASGGPTDNLRAPAGSVSEVAAAPTRFGRYTVRELLGRGGLGEVFVGYDPQLDRPVAIKVPRVRDAGAHEALLQEARHVAQFSHPGIVAVHDVGIHDGRFYIVSELLTGTSLERWLRANSPTWEDTARIVAAVADALAYAHERRVVHRDVKPANIVMKENGVPVLIDFGLAISDSTESQVGVIAGTYHYMSPEQALGRGHRIDGRTDVYALGVVLYRMLTGRVPFQSADRQELIRQVCDDPPQPPRQLVTAIPAELERVCLKALSKRPDDRHTTAADLARELRGLGAPGDSGREGSSKSTPAGPRGAERRQVTVVHCRCDLFDSPAFLEEFDPEDQHELLTDYQRVCDRAVARFGGTVVQSSGQELLVCLGYPISYEDAAQRAVRLSLAIRDDVAEFGRRAGGGPPAAPTVAIGIHTGVAVVEERPAGPTAERLSVAGEARTVATQLQAFTQPNTVTITQATRQIVRGLFRCEGLGPQAVKGAAQPVELFRVLGETEARTRLDAEAGTLTPLIGREIELTVLTDRWDRAAEGEGQVVLVGGEPGLGKSRLVRELRERVTRAEAGTASTSGTSAAGPGPVVEWRCSPYFQNTDFYPAVDAFERLLQFTRDDPPGHRLDRLVAHLEPFGLADPAVVPLFAALLSVPTDGRFPPLNASPQRLKDLTREAILDWAGALAATHPLLFIVEDLHWADPTTLDFLDLLAGRAGNERLLLLLTFRPEFDRPVAGKAHQTELSLTRLSRRQVMEMVERKVGVNNLPAEVAQQILERTDGVPLFIEEFAQVLAESQALQSGTDSVRAVGLSLAGIPSTLQDLLMARLDRLECLPEVTQMAAVLGREFTYDWLQPALDLPEPVLQAELAKLVRAGILFQKGRPPRSTYTFKHALLQDAAYQSLLRKRKQQFHQTCAEVLEARFPDRVEKSPELLAHHFTAAGRYETAVKYWQKAGVRAQARSANPEAISHLTRGLNVLTDHLPPSAEREALELSLQAPLGVVLTAAHGWGSAAVAPTIERARELAERVGSPADRFFVLWGVWGFRLLRLELDRCRELAAEVMALVESEPAAGSLRFEAHWPPGCTAFYAGEFAEARRHFEQGWALYERGLGPQNALRTGQNVGVLYQAHIAVLLWEAGFPEQAGRQAEETVRFARELDHPFSLAMALYYRRRVFQACGFRDRVEASVEEEIALCRQHGFAFWLAHALFARGEVLILRGQLDEAAAQVRPIYELVVASGCKCSVSHPYAFLADAYLRTGRPTEAEEWLARGFDLVENHNERCLESEFWRLKGELAAAAGDREQAEACIRKALDSARLRQARSRELRALTSLVRLKPEETPLLAELVAGFAEGGETTDLQAARKLLGRDAG